MTRILPTHKDTAWNLGRFKAMPDGARSVPVAEVLDQIPTTGTFTVNDLRDQTGCSRSTARRAVDAAVDAGIIISLGRDPDHTGPGRASKLYTRT